MPELPDVEIYRQTAEKAKKKKIRGVTAHDKQFDRIDEKEIDTQFKNKKITRTSRRGKHLFLFSSKDFAMVMHFGMTGDLKYVQKKEDLPEYTKLELQFDNDDKLAYISKRKLGFVAFTDNPEKFIEENDIGADALELSKSEFIKKIKSKKSMIKSALMDQSVTSGIGNVYSDEILYQCGLHPKTKTTDLTDEDWGNLHKSMKSVMKTAIDKDARPSKLPKSYLTRHRKEGEKCPKCKGEIKKMKISGRGMYFCPSCQKQK